MKPGAHILVEVKTVVVGNNSKVLLTLFESPFHTLERRLKDTAALIVVNLRVCVCGLSRGCVPVLVCMCVYMFVLNHRVHTGKQELEVYTEHLLGKVHRAMSPSSTSRALLAMFTPAQLQQPNAYSPTL